MLDQLPAIRTQNVKSFAYCILYPRGWFPHLFLLSTSMCGNTQIRCTRHSCFMKDSIILYNIIYK